MLIGSSFQVETAQNVYYDKPVGIAKTEVFAWGQMYQTLLSSGVPATGAAAFSFTNPSMNGPIFSPLRAAQFTAMTSLGGSTTLCPGEVASADIEGVLVAGEVSSNLIAEPEKSLVLLEAAVADGEIEVGLAGETLVISNLSAAPVTGSLAGPVWATPSTTTLTWLAGLMSATNNYAQGLVHSDDARRRLLGAERSVDQIEAFIAR
jgi:hypothetical protein